MRVRIALIVALAAVYASALRLTGQVAGGVGAQGQRSPARDWTQDMAMKITEPFSLASVGDVIIVSPASRVNDPGLQSALKVIHDSDAGFGNFESLIRDERTFAGPLSGSMVGTKEVAADLKAMGFTLMNRAGNHLIDSGPEGICRDRAADGRGRARLRGLRPESGRSAGAAIRRNAERPHRSGRHVQRDRGRTVAAGRDASGSGVTGGRPGLNAMNLTRAIAVTPEHLALLKTRQGLRCTSTAANMPTRCGRRRPIRPRRSTSSAPSTSRAARPGELTYVMNTRDLQDNLRSIKNGKEYADFMIATIHAHQGDSILQSFLFEDHPPDFLVELAHQAIDNGADAFVGHGPHVLRGIEIYKGKPIFYDLGEFFREWDWSCDCNVSPNGDLTQAEKRRPRPRGARRRRADQLRERDCAEPVRQGPVAGGAASIRSGAAGRPAVSPRACR